jgi:hypothetical protein
MRRLLLTVLSGVSLWAALPATAHAELKAIWGPNSLPNGKSAFPSYERLGVDVLERQLLWNVVARTRPQNPRDPGDPAYHWPADVDVAAVAMRRRGMRLALMIKGTPPWANGGRGPGWAPTRAADVADFAVAAARHYRRVRHWMVWGEPALQGNFEPWAAHPRRMAHRYARIIDATYAALKSVRRSIVVIAGGTFNGQPTPMRWFLRWLRLPDGRPPRLDWFSHNPYGVRYPSLRHSVYHPQVRDMGDVDTYIQEIRRTYRRIHRTPRLWLSEFAVQSDHANRGFSFYVTRWAQARWLRAAYRIAHSQSYVAGLGWFSLLDEPGPRGLTGGLLTASGERKPAWYAYRAAR